jgi:AcrR family transcriptional regulator
LHDIGTSTPCKENPLAKRPDSIRGNAADETRSNILNVAMREFADKGLAGARIDEIAEKTATSKRMIYYYFGGKDELYRAVLETAYAAIRTREAAENFEAMPATDALKAQVEHTFDYHADNPAFVRLVMNENILHGAHIGHVSGLQERNRSVIASLKAILDKGVDEGVFRSGLDPIQLHMTISALCFYNVSNRYTFSANFGVNLGDPAILQQRRGDVVATVLRYCAM